MQTTRPIGEAANTGVAPQVTPPAIPTAVPPQTEGQPPVITPEFVKQQVDLGVAEALKRVRQSEKARAQQVNAKLDAIAAKIEATGGQVTPQMREALREEISSEPQEIAPASTIPAQTASDEALHPVVKETLDVFAQTGITIEKGDPEYKALNDALVDPDGNITAYRQVLYAAIASKKARVSSNETTAAARVFGGGQNINGEVGSVSTRSLWADAHKK